MKEKLQTPFDFYTRRVGEVQFSAEEANKRCRLLQTGSLILLLLICTVLYEALIPKKVPVWISVVPFAALAVVVNQTKKYRSSVLKLVSLREYYEKGIARLKRDWDSLDDGKDF